MKSPRNQLILVGLMCQAFSWDDYFLPLLSILLWVLCLKLPRKPLNLGPLFELSLVPLGAAAGYFIGITSGKSIHFFVGHGLTLIQVVRLLRPLNRREKFLSILVACIQIGVACTVVLDYRFILIFLATIILIPRALMQLEQETFQPSKPDNKKEPSASPGVEAIHESVRWSPDFSLSAWFYFALALVTITFYLAFPRGFLGTGIQAPGLPGTDTTLADSLLDPASGGIAQSERVILQIQGERLGYLRCFALVDLEDGKWVSDKWELLQPMPSLPPEQLTNNEHRRVRVKNANYLGRILPTDGEPLQVTGKFFKNPQRTSHGAIRCQVMWNTANNVYEYWMNPKPKYEELNSRLARRCTAYPPQSQRLEDWLDETLPGAKTPLEQVRYLESYFKRNFTYKIGAPQLSRLNTADDFIFNQRQGHCERYAATLALLLRMKGIPSRIVVGYLPNTRGWFSGWHNVRFKDAHAWTEAWFKDAGWVQFDATPAATMDRSGNQIRELLDALDFIWYSNVVAFDAPTQSKLLAASVQSLGNAVTWLIEFKFVLGAIILFIGALIVWRKLPRNLKKRKDPARLRTKMQAMAEHFYGQMLQALERQGLERLPHQTPLEFLRELKARSLPAFAEVQLITEVFCATRYGMNMLSTDQLFQVEKALQRVKKEKNRT